MIITSHEKLEIGKVYSNNNHRYGLEIRGVIYTKYAFLVLRECTEEEYKIELKEIYPDNWEEILSWEYFYDIHSD